jgi:TPR repeat protein
VADWKLLEHIFQDLGAGAKSPSALLSEGYQRLFGVDTQQQQCAIAKKSLKEATQPLLELIRTRVPSPFLEIDEHAVPPVKLNEQYTGQAMGSFKVPAEYDKMDLIDYYRLQADDPQLHAPKTAIGSIYLYGTYGFARDYKRAAYYFNAADKVQPSSQLGYMHHMGLVNGEVNMAKAIQLYSRAAAHNDSFALTQMGLLYLRGSTEANIKPDTRKALQYLGKAADKDEVNANFHLGFLYRNGYGPDIPIDAAKALKFIIVAASRGHLGALLELATLTGKCEDSVHLYFRVLHSVLLQPLAYRAHEFYNYGFYDHAAVLYNLMAAMGHETGQLNAAWLHERGLVSSASINLQDLSNLLPLNVPSLSANPSEAAAQLSQQSLSSLKSRIEEISEAGYIDATTHHTGQVDQYEEDYVDMVIDSNGRSTGPDREKASWEHQRHSFELYRLAAQQGSAEAQLKQGDFYYYGIGVATDFNKSAQFYTLAATAKHAQATFNLGYMYQRGLGVAQDLHLAKRYYDAAMVASPDAYLAGSLALASLAIQDLFLGNSQPTHLSWDNSLLLFLTIVAFCTIIMKFRLRNRA